MVNQGWYKDDKGNWKVTTREVKRQMEEVKNKKSFHNEAIAVTYNPETNNLILTTTDEITYKIPVNDIEELKDLPKKALSKICLYSVPDSGIHIESIDINILVDSLLNVNSNLIKKAI